MIGVQIDEGKLLEGLKAELETIYKQVAAVKQPDELLTKTRLATEVFDVDLRTLNKHILSQSDFPFIQVGDKTKYSRHAVEDWIRRRQITNRGMYQWEDFKKRGARKK